MNIRRHLSRALAALLLSVAPAAAQDYPTKPVRLLVGYAAGGPTDTVARLLAAKLQGQLGQPFIVENKPGAGSNIASDLAAAAAPDGYTLLVAAAPIVVNGFLYKNLRWQVQRSFEPIALVMSAPGVLAVAPEVPAHNLQELIALAKEKPNTLSFASTGNGGTQHLAGELLKKRAGIELTHIPYKGSAGAYTDLMAGQVTMGFVTSVGAMPYLKDGKIRPIAVAAVKRLPQLPDVPTMAEAGLPDFESDSWSGVFAPKGTPPEIIAKLSDAIAKAVASPDVRETIQRQGGLVVGGPPDVLRDRVQQDTERWGKFLQTNPIRLY